MYLRDAVEEIVWLDVLRQVQQEGRHLLHGEGRQPAHTHRNRRHTDMYCYKKKANVIEWRCYLLGSVELQNPQCDAH